MIDLKKTYDAIVVGTGAARGFAAKELSEGGLEILVLEAGPRLDPAKDFKTHTWPYEMPFRGFDRPGERKRSHWTCWTADEYSKNLYVDDREHPYTTDPDKPFTWVWSRFVGGKLLHWGRHSKRFSNLDFRAADHDDYGDNWPITYEDLAPYYDQVEGFAGVSGSIENIPHLPDGKFLPHMPLTCGERFIQRTAPKLGMRVIPTRTAQRRRPINGLAPCHYCGSCGRGCDVGGMWNSVSDTLPAAERTGRMTLRPNSVVRHVLVDGNGKPNGSLLIAKTSNLTKQGGKLLFWAPQHWSRRGSC